MTLQIHNQRIRNLISIHTLRMEGDPGVWAHDSYGVTFQSTPSAWRVTRWYAFHNLNISISIHTLRMEGDGYFVRVAVKCNLISIHTLRMEGDPRRTGRGEEAHGISIHTLRMEGDQKQLGELCGINISIHTLRMEGDLRVVGIHVNHHISIHTLRMEGDQGSPNGDPQPRNFNPHPPHGG